MISCYFLLASSKVQNRWPSLYAIYEQYLRTFLHIRAFWIMLGQHHQDAVPLAWMCTSQSSYWPISRCHGLPDAQEAGVQAEPIGPAGRWPRAWACRTSPWDWEGIGRPERILEREVKEDSILISLILTFYLEDSLLKNLDFWWIKWK